MNKVIKTFCAAFYLCHSCETESGFVHKRGFFWSFAVESLWALMALIVFPLSQTPCVCPSRLFVNKSHSDSLCSPILIHTAMHTCITVSSVGVYEAHFSNVALKTQRLCLCETMCVGYPCGKFNSAK